MIEITADILTLGSSVKGICIPTNCQKHRNGMAVMGAGLAKQAANKWPYLAPILGHMMDESEDPAQVFTLTLVDEYGSIVLREVHEVTGHHIFAFPTKHDWRFPSSMDLVQTSAKQLAAIVNDMWPWQDAVGGREAHAGEVPR
jgi:hypothetical protein